MKAISKGWRNIQEISPSTLSLLKHWKIGFLGCFKVVPREFFSFSFFAMSAPGAQEDDGAFGCSELISRLMALRVWGANCAGTLSSMWLIGPLITLGSVNVALQALNELVFSCFSARHSALALSVDPSDQTLNGNHQIETKLHKVMLCFWVLLLSNFYSRDT